MTEEKAKKVTAKSTKQELLDAYNSIVKELEEKRQLELKPERRAAEQVTKQAVTQADGLSLNGISRGIGDLKSEITKTLSSIGEKLEAEVSKYQEIKIAVTKKEKELVEIYDIQKATSSLAALIEAQNQRRDRFEQEMEEKRRTLQSDIDESRKKWETEKAQYEATLKEKKDTEEKQRQRQKEEYEYTVHREQQLSQDKFADEQKKAAKELEEKRQAVEKDLAEREQTVAKREEKIEELDKRIADLEKNKQQAVKNAIEETANKLQNDYSAKEMLLNKQFEG